MSREVMQCVLVSMRVCLQGDFSNEIQKWTVGDTIPH